MDLKSLDLLTFRPHHQHTCTVFTTRWSGVWRVQCPFFMSVCLCSLNHSKIVTVCLSGGAGGETVGSRAPPRGLLFRGGSRWWADTSWGDGGYPEPSGPSESRHCPRTPSPETACPTWVKTWIRTQIINCYWTLWTWLMWAHRRPTYC